MIRFFLVLIILSIFIVGCHSENEDYIENCFCEDSCKKITLKQSKEIHIPVSGFQYDFDIATVYRNGSNSELWGYNNFDKQFYIYDIARKKLLDTIPIFLNGKNAIPSIFGFKVLSPDSILIHTNHYNQLILINSNAEKIKTWEIKGDLPGRGMPENLYYLSVWKDYNNFFIDKNGKKATFFVENLGFESWTEPRFYPQFAEWSLETNQFLSAFGDYPDIYKDERYTNYRSTMPFAVSKEATWASFFHSHCIFIFDEQKNKSIICSKSQYLPEKFDFLPAGLTPSERDPFLIPKGEYSNLIYDKYRQILYRIVIHGLPVEKVASEDYTLRLQSPWSIMFLDRNGICLGEVKFEKNKYHFDRVFAIAEGLIVSLENPYSVKNEEKLLSFELFELELK